MQCSVEERFEKFTVAVRSIKWNNSVIIYNIGLVIHTGVSKSRFSIHYMVKCRQAVKLVLAYILFYKRKLSLLSQNVVVKVGC